MIVNFSRKKFPLFTVFNIDYDKNHFKYETLMNSLLVLILHSK